MIYRFRAWDADGKRMIPFGLFDLDMGGFDLDTMTVVDDMPIMQTTGYKDKYGVEIYEGDIIEYSTPKRMIVHAWEVVAEQDGFILRNTNEYHIEEYDLLWDDRWRQRCKVIGNKYANKELIHV